MGFSPEYLTLLHKTKETLIKESETIPWLKWSKSQMKDLSGQALGRGISTSAEDIYSNRPFMSKARTAIFGPKSGPGFSESADKVIDEHLAHKANRATAKPWDKSSLGAGAALGAGGILGAAKGVDMYDKSKVIKDRVQTYGDSPPPQTNQFTPKELELLRQYYGGRV